MKVFGLCLCVISVVNFIEVVFVEDFLMYCVVCWLLLGVYVVDLEDFLGDIFIGFGVEVGLFVDELIELIVIGGM